MNARRVVVFDTETTGRSPDYGDRIVEIGAVEMIGFETGRTFHAYLNPQRDVPDEVVRVHGLTGAFLADKPLFSAIVEDLLAFFGDDPIVAHNAEFDRRFLNAELERLGRDPHPSNRYVDTLALARSKMPPGKRLSLDALAREFRLDRMGFDLAERKGAGGHGALLDARMLCEIYIALQGGREQVLFAEEKAAVLVHAAAKLTFAPRRQRPTPWISFISKEEAAAHEAFVAELGEAALWNKLRQPA